MKSFVPILFLLFGLTSISFAKTFEKCELVREFRRHGFPEHLMKDLICLVDAESSFRTHVKGPPNTDGSFDWGLFQINDRYWCNVGSPGKGCNVRCEDLLLDDISAAASCAKTVLARQGIDAWTGWVSKCKGRAQPELNC